MPKKTSRSARALQAQRTALTGERRTAARPLIDVNNSRLAAEAGTDFDDATSDLDVALEPKTAPVPEPVMTARTVSATTARPLSEARPGQPPVSGSPNVIRPAAGSRRPVARRSSTVLNRAPAISREEEYAYIRTDLLTVFALTVLMIAALVILTFVIGR